MRFRNWAGALTIVAVLAGCVGGGAIGGSSTKSVLQGAMRISAPPGYCIDQTASTETGDQALVLMGRCNQQSGVKPAVLSVSIGPSGSAGVMAADGTELAGFFTSNQGRATLAPSGRASDVHVSEALSAKGAFLMRLRQADGPAYWRAFLGLGGRLVSISVQPSPKEPLSVEDGRKILDRTIAAMQRANRS